MFKVAERFLSIQGEGFWSGLPMYFVRLSQCPVGGQSGLCVSWDGTTFQCDTGPNWHSGSKGPEWHPYTVVSEQLSAQDIVGCMRDAQCKTLCVTGGEPGVYPLEQILEMIDVNAGERMHIETSGTVDMKVLSYGKRIGLWVTMSPKVRYIVHVVASCDEIKLLVHNKSTVEDVKKWVHLAASRPLCLQPIDGPTYKENLENAMELCQRLGVRLSLQMHKILQVR